MLTIYLLLVLLGVATFHVLTRYSYRGRLANKMQGDFAYPIFGNLLRYNVSCVHELWKRVRRQSNKYYPITRLWYFTSAVISVRDADDMEVLLSSQKAITKGYVYNYLQPWLKTGLLTSTDDKWRARRKILTPAFHFNILKKYLINTNEETKKSIEKLKSEGSEIVKNAASFSTELTLNVICESAMNVSLDKMENNASEYKKALHDFGYIVVYRIPRPFVADWMMKPVWRIGRLQRDSLKVLHDFTNKVVNERRAYHVSTQNKFLKEIENSNDDNFDIRKSKRLSMLDLLLAAEQKGLIDDAGIKEEVDTFTFEGHDTTGMGLTFTLMLLAENKEAQDRAREEVTELLDRTNGKIDMADLKDLSYLELCIKESLRLFPPVATIFRYIDEDLQLKNALIPGKTHLMLNLYDTHRDPKHWPDPDKFIPERFLPENVKNRHPFAYIPFSAGPRNCIGQKFAMMELKITIARILYDFYLEPIDYTADMRLLADVVIRTLDPIHIKFVRINKK